MRSPWHLCIHWNTALIGLLAIATPVGLLALALSGYVASAGVLALVIAIDGCLYWKGRSDKPTSNPVRDPVHYLEPVTGAH